MDPVARGVLPICLGQGTRLMDYVTGGLKRYLVGVKLGVTTTTYDAEGELVRTGDVGGLTREMVESVSAHSLDAPHMRGSSETSTS